jgi:two-component system chemotaxis sensor kinase CheA
MSFELDEDILQDFLVEAGEILELLSEQLIELENNPEDADLLNAIFRGFHTVKGGAGFLAMTELVDACHGAENVFDILRQGQISVTSELMDVILQALDCINIMFACIQNREKPEAADPNLLKAMHDLCKPQSEGEVSPPHEATAPEIDNSLTTSPEEGLSSDFDDVLFDMDDTSSDDSNIDDISEDEFESLLDELHGSGKGPIVEESKGQSEITNDASDGDITDDQFENLLDELHGVGSFGETQSAAPEEKNNVVESTPIASSDSEDISDDEFEALLDELHGKGQGPKTVESASTPAQKPEVESKPKVEKKVEKPVAKPVLKPQAKTEQKPKPVAKPAAEKPSAKSPAVQAETTVRVDTKRLDQIMNMVGELVLVRNRLVSLGATNSSESMNKAISNLDVVTADLQSAVMKTRMQPIKKVFGRFPRVVRDLARSLKKDINLQLVGEDTDLDKNLVEALADPLVHLVRNSVDHGIEMPDEREATGKSRTGTVTLSASQEGDHILLTIEDDGAGMDPDKLKDIAIGKGVIDADFASRMTDNEAFNLIFAPGFSTKEEISDISGRGVGMDVVKTKITQLNGSINIESQRGTGTTLEIKVPLTLAILPTLMVLVEEQTFALPLACVNEIFHLDLSKTNIVDGQLTIIVRDKAIPLFYLESWLVKNPSSIADQRSGDGHVVIVQLGTQQIGFAVDSLIGQEEVVIKPLDALLQGTPGMAGATITSDGGIALILDVPNLLKHYAGKVK